MLELKQDSAWSWLVLSCVLGCQIVLGGICLSSGLFLLIFTNAFDADPVETSWLCSLPATMWFIASPLGSILTNRYGCRVCSFIGGLLAASGLCLSYFATSSLFLFFSHGFLTGLGLGINFTGCMSALNLYFDRYKIMATGMASIGLHIGLIIFADLMLSLENNYSWRGMFLILGGIAFNLCAFSMAMIPFSIKRNEGINYNSTDNVSSLDKKIFSINCSVFKKLSFVLFCTSNFFVNCSNGMYILHLPSYSKNEGFTQNEIGRVLTIYAITSIIGKVFFSFLGQHPKVNVILLYAISLAVAGVSTGLTPIFLSRTGMLVLAGIYGFFFCTTGALLNAVVYKIVGFSRFADGLGISLPFKATGNLIGGPMAGVLLEATGSHSFSFYLAGIIMVLAAILMIHPITHIIYREKNHRSQIMNTVFERKVEECRNEAINEKANRKGDEVATLLDPSSKII